MKTLTSSKMGQTCCPAFLLVFWLFFLGTPTGWCDAVITANDINGLVGAVDTGGQITFANGGGTFNLNQTLYVVRDTTIDGSGGSTVIRGNGSNRVFYVYPGVKLTLIQLSINNGKDVVGGGIYNGGILTLSNCTMSANVAAGNNGTVGAPGTKSSRSGQNGTDGISGYGGAIYNVGSIFGTNVTFANNTSTGGNGGNGGNGTTNANTPFGGNGGNGGMGAYAFGGAIFNTGKIMLTNAAFSGNTTTSGNGGTNGLGSGLTNTTTVAGLYPGSAGNGGAGGIAGGGAIYSAGHLELYATSFVGNQATGGNSQGTRPNMNAQSGGLAVGGAIYSTGSLLLQNSTIAANSIRGGNGGAGPGGVFPRAGGKGGDAIGGGICNAGVSSVGFCTLAGNFATNGTGGLGGVGTVSAPVGHAGSILGANVANLAGSFSMDDTILAYPSGGGLNSFGTLVDRGYNLSSDLSGPTGPKSWRGLDPKLSNISYNSTLGTNRTATMALKAGSPALNSASRSAFPPTDQLGQTRKVPDIGAFESIAYFFISGKVTRSGLPQPGLKVSLSRNSDATPIVSFLTDAGGNFRVAGLVSGFYTLSVPNGGKVPTTRSVDILASDLVSVNIETAN